MPHPRFQKLDPERQEAIVEAATRELAARGPEQASLNKILSDAGLSKGAAYYYFDDREDLFATVVSRAIDLAVRTIGGVGPIDSAAGFWAEFRGLYERVLGFLRAHPTLAALAKRLASSPALSSPTVARRFDAFRVWFADFLRRGQRVGAIRADLPLDLLVTLGFAMGEALDRWTIAHWDDVARSDASLSALVDAGMDLFRRALSPAALPGTPPADAPRRPRRKR